MFNKIKNYQNTQIDNLKFLVNSHLAVMLVAHILGQLVLILGISEMMETREGDFNILALLTVVITLGVFFVGFSKSFRKSKTMLTFDFELNQKTTNYAAIIYYFILIVYWIPLFLTRGLAGADRGAWRQDNAGFFAHHTCVLMFPIALAAVSNRRIRWYNILLICLFQNLLMLGIGEQFTGLVMNLPLLAFLFSRKQICLAVAGVLSSSIVYKLSRYYGFTSADSLTSSSLEVLLTRTANEAGLMNSIVNQKLSWKIFDHPSALLPYQAWGLTDKPLVMSYTLNYGIYEIALETGGLVTGTIADVMSFMFSPLVSIIASYFLGVYSAWLLVAGIYFVNASDPKRHILGILTFLVYQLRVMPIIHSGVLSSFFKLDHLIVVLILWINLRETKRKLDLQG